MESWDINFNNLTIGYDQKVILKDISSTLPKGKISIVLGESGCGKSTLLKHIIGLSKPISGNINIGGHDLFSLSNKEFRRIRKHMGVLFQDGALLGALTLAQNVTLPLSEHLNLSKAELDDEANRVLSMVGLQNFGSYYPNELSGGMRKRAGLARAIITNPKILLCDEPTSGLDPITADKMDNLLKEMHNLFTDMTIVVVSHDLSSLKKIADHVLVLHDKIAIFSGNITELQQQDNPYLQRFLNRHSEDEEKTFKKGMNSKVQSALDQWLSS